jgi:hypothetical protein
MKYRVNIREFIEDNADHSDMLLVHASVDLDDLFETNCIPEEQEIDIDIHGLLAANRQIAHILGVDDVQQQRPDLDDDQAWAVLQDAEKYLDLHNGITWDTLKILSDELYPGNLERRWQGRIDVSVENYTREAAVEHFEQMAAHVERNSVNSTTKATFDHASFQPLEPNETINQ